MLVSDLNESSLVPRRYLVQRLRYRFAPNPIGEAGTESDSGRSLDGVGARVSQPWDCDTLSRPASGRGRALSQAPRMQHPGPPGKARRATSLPTPRPKRQQSLMPR